MILASRGAAVYGPPLMMMIGGLTPMSFRYTISRVYMAPLSGALHFRRPIERFKVYGAGARYWRDAWHYSCRRRAVISFTPTHCRHVAAPYENISPRPFIFRRRERQAPRGILLGSIIIYFAAAPRAAHKAAASIIRCTALITIFPGFGRYDAVPRDEGQRAGLYFHISPGVILS